MVLHFGKPSKFPPFFRTDTEVIKFYKNCLKAKAFENEDIVKYFDDVLQKYQTSQKKKAKQPLLPVTGKNSDIKTLSDLFWPGAYNAIYDYLQKKRIINTNRIVIGFDKTLYNVL